MTTLRYFSRKELIFLVAFFVVQFFWVTAAFVHSDTRAEGDDRTRDSRTDSISPSPPAPAPTPMPTPTPASSPGPSLDSSISAPPSVAPVRLDTSSVRAEFQDVGGSFDAPILSTTNPNALPAGPHLATVFLPGGSVATTTQTFSLTGDLGAQIKYCIVFPILRSAPPVPFFNVPTCPSGFIPSPLGAPQLRVSKVVVNDNGGTAAISDFKLFVGSTTVTSGNMNTFLVGTYAVSEATTTFTVGSTTTQYAQSFSGDCSSSGMVTLALGDVKTCTIINNDVGQRSSGSGGSGGGSGGSGGGGGGSGGGGGGGSSSSSGGGGGSGGSGGGGGAGPFSTGGGGGSGAGSYPTPPGQVLGSTNPPYMGGGEGIPGAPNTGLGGNFNGNLGLLIFSFVASQLGLIYLYVSMRRPDF